MFLVDSSIPARRHWTAFLCRLLLACHVNHAGTAKHIDLWRRLISIAKDTSTPSLPPQSFPCFVLREQVPAWTAITVSQNLSQGCFPTCTHDISHQSNKEITGQCNHAASDMPSRAPAEYAYSSAIRDYPTKLPVRRRKPLSSIRSPNESEHPQAPMKLRWSSHRDSAFWSTCYRAVALPVKACSLSSPGYRQH
jgi:hypothetical protein